MPHLCAQVFQLFIKCPLLRQNMEIEHRYSWYLQQTHQWTGSHSGPPLAVKRESHPGDCVARWGAFYIAGTVITRGALHTMMQCILAWVYIGDTISPLWLKSLWSIFDANMSISIGMFVCTNLQTRLNNEYFMQWKLFNNMKKPSCWLSASVQRCVTSQKAKLLHPTPHPPPPPPHPPPSPIFHASPQEQGVSHFTEHPDALTCTATAATRHQLSALREWGDPCNLSCRFLTVNLNSNWKLLFDIFHFGFFIMPWYPAQITVPWRPQKRAWNGG